jgi:glycosyltransferase involved in cell wall biosynthesis
VSNRFFIYATNIHQGGGRALLSALLEAPRGLTNVVALLDSRMPVPEGVSENGLLIKRVIPSVIERFKAERWLANNVLSGDIVLCFGNLPPIFKLSGHTVVFLQNRYLIDDVWLNNFPIKTRARICMERLWLYTRMSNADEFVVQTPTMKRLLDAKTQGKMPVRMLPFMAKSSGYVRSVSSVKAQKKEMCDFLYVASGEPHKNHLQLIKAWCFLAEEGFFPLLTLTLDRVQFRTLCCEIEEMCRRYKLKVTNRESLSHDDIFALYETTDALIYPSTFESFGLPLIEARQANLPVLAPELDYVRDLLDPEQTFDPKSPISIAKAVKRFMGFYEPPLPLLDTEHFIQNIFENIK